MLAFAIIVTRIIIMDMNPTAALTHISAKHHNKAWQSSSTTTSVSTFKAQSRSLLLFKHRTLVPH
jgi:hypothetical protein